MMCAERGGFDDAEFDDAPEADVVEQLIPVTVDDEDEAMSDLRRVRVSTDAAEADLIDQAIVVPLDDESDFDR
ncbi:hypothetical protein [Mycobacterium sp. URHD0025]|uniref:hypothetical protein n=1 Tax=Mycobacterium sp. URHD0025 TaxID=1298864 RepID=UPI00048C12B7|nr:hypothetical protein [Mycobacterium sp. URHD0025]